MAFSQQHNTLAASESISLTPGGSKNGNPSANTHANINGDLNNLSSMRIVAPPIRDPEFAYLSLAIPASEDGAEVRSEYRPFLLSEEPQQTDWVSKLELATVTEMASHDLQATGERLKVLVLYGSLRSR